MVQVVPDSPSLVLRATHILLIRIAAAAAGDKTFHPSGYLEQRSTVSVVLEEVLKGSVKEQPGQQVQIQTIQLSTESLWVTPVPGVWSHVSLDPGTRLVAYAIGQTDSAATLLVEPALQALLPAENALDGVRLVIEAEDQGLPLDEIVRRAHAIAGSLYTLFPEYLWAKYGAAAVTDMAVLEPLMAFFEDPQLSTPARQAFLTLSLGHMVSGVASPQTVARYVVALFRLLGVEKAGVLHDNIISTYLPAVLGLQPGSTPRPAADVFANDPAARRQAQQSLSAYQGSAGSEQLLAWLKS